MVSWSTAGGVWHAFAAGVHVVPSLSEKAESVQANASWATMVRPVPRSTSRMASSEKVLVSGASVTFVHVTLLGVVGVKVARIVYRPAWYITTSFRGSTPMLGSPNARPPSAISSGVGGMSPSGTWYVANPGAPPADPGSRTDARFTRLRVATACDATASELAPS